MAIIDKPIRYAPQTRQERISRKQFSERLDEFGWIANPPDQDLGQDFIVDIYFQGRAAGVNFYVQLKSVTNLHERRRGDYLPYDFEVKDLKHWETFELPVVLVVWDVELREGRWALVDTAIAELDRRRSQWRSNSTTASVRIPWNNTTDDAGLVQLRKSIGRRLYPLIFQDKPPGELRLELSFPDTQEGRAAQHAFDRWVKEGESVTLKGEYVRKFERPPWVEQWLGEFEPGEGKLTLTPPTSPEILEVGIDFISANGELISYSSPIQLKVVQAGKEIKKFSNEHQDAPLHFCFVVPRLDREVTITFKINNLGRHMHETRDILRFLSAMAAGGRLRLTFLSHDNVWQEFVVPPHPDNLSVTIEDWTQLVDKLCAIQDKTGQFLQMPIEGPTTKDMQAIDRLVAIIKLGKIVREHVEVTEKFKKQDLNSILDVARQIKLIRIRGAFDESYVELFGTEVQTKRIAQQITGILEMPVAELEQAIAKLAPGEFLSIKLVNAEVVEIFPDWYIREAQRLSQHLVDDFGAKSVYLFGSLAWGDVYAPETDIDLAVADLPAEHYFKAVGYLERESNFPVDLVDLNSIPDRLRQRILAEGKKLNERKAVTAVSG